MKGRLQKLVIVLFVVVVMGLFALPLAVLPNLFGYIVGYYALAVLILSQVLRFLVSAVKRAINELIDNA